MFLFNMLEKGYHYLYPQEELKEAIYNVEKKHDNNIEKVLQLIQSGKADINHRDEDGNTPLWWACNSILKYPWQKDFEKQNPLLINAILPYCSEENINNVNNKGETILHLICYHSNNRKLFKLIFPLCSDETVNKANNRGETALVKACQFIDKKNSIEIIKLLLPRCSKRTVNKIYKYKLNNYHRYYEASPLHEICFQLKDDSFDNSTRLEIIKLLLAYCATKKSINKAVGYIKNDTPIYLAMKHINLAAVKLLLENGAEIKKYTSDHLDRLENGKQDSIVRGQAFLPIKSYIDSIAVLDEEYPEVEDVLLLTRILRERYKTQSLETRRLFNSFLRMIFVRSTQEVIKNPTKFYSTAFCELYTKSLYNSGCRSELKECLGIDPRQFAYEPYIKEVIKNNHFFFAKKMILDSKFHKNLNKQRKYVVKRIIPDLEIICQDD